SGNDVISGFHRNAHSNAGEEGDRGKQNDAKLFHLTPRSFLIGGRQIRRRWRWRWRRNNPVAPLGFPPSIVVSQSFYPSLDDAEGDAAVAHFARARVARCSCKRCSAQTHSDQKYPQSLPLLHSHGDPYRGSSIM